MSRKRPKLAGGKKIVPPPKKATNKKGETIKAPAKKKVSGKESTAAEKASDSLRLQRLLAAISFGLCGCVIGVLTGANQMVPIPSEIAGSAMLALIWTGAAVGSQVFHAGLAFQLGLLGVMIGSTLGFSVLMDAGVMLVSWLAAGGLLSLTFGFTHNYLLAGFGWVAGILPFILKEVRGGT